MQRFRKLISMLLAFGLVLGLCGVPVTVVAAGEGLKMELRARATPQIKGTSPTILDVYIINDTDEDITFDGYQLFISTEEESFVGEQNGFRFAAAFGEDGLGWTNVRNNGVGFVSANGGGVSTTKYTVEKKTNDTPTEVRFGEVRFTSTDVPAGEYTFIFDNTDDRLSLKLTNGSSDLDVDFSSTAKVNVIDAGVFLKVDDKVLSGVYVDGSKVYVGSAAGGAEITGGTITPTVIKMPGKEAAVITWDIDDTGEGSGVSIDATGVITVSAKADEDTYTVTATSDIADTFPVVDTNEGKTATTTFTVTRAAEVPHSIETFTFSDMGIPGVGAAVISVTPDPLTIKNQFDDTYEGTTQTVWSISPTTVNGVTINTATGQVTVADTAAGQIADTTGTNFTLTATCGDAVNSAGFTIKREAPVATSAAFYTNDAVPVRVGATDTIIIPETSTTKTYVPKLLDQYGTLMPSEDQPSADTWTWSLTPGEIVESVNRVSQAAGVVSVTSDATKATHTLTATADGKTAIVSILVTDVDVNWAPIVLKDGGITYGDSKASAFTNTFPLDGKAETTGGQRDGTFTIKDADEILEAGEKTITVVFTIDTDTYEKTYNVTVAQKPITATVEPASRAYGAANPSFDVSVPTGAMVGEDALADQGLNLVSAADANSVPGTYDVTQVGGGTSHENANYIITIDGEDKLTITKAALTVKTAPTFSDILANNSVNASESELAASVLEAVPNVSMKYGTEETEVSIPVTAWTITDTGDTYSIKGGDYKYAATLNLGDNFTFEGTIVMDVTVTSVTGTIAQVASVSKAEAVVAAATTYADLGLPETLTVDYDNAVADGVYDIIGWSKTVVELNALKTNDTVTLTPTVQGIPAWATIANDDLENAKVQFTVTAKTLVDVTVTLADTTYGTPLAEPTVTKTAGGVEFEGEYTLSYVGTGNTVYGPTATAPTNAGTYTVTATVDTATHYGTASVDFEILAKDLTAGMITFTDVGPFTYSGNTFTPAFKVMDGTKTLVASTDYNYVYINNLDAGTASLLMMGIGNYGGVQVEKNFTIGKADAPTAKTISREYPNEAATYTIDLNDLLPQDVGPAPISWSTNWADTDTVINADPTFQNGAITLATKAAVANTTLTITAVTQNYEDITITLNIALIAKAIPHIDLASAEITGSLTYGQPLSATGLRAGVFASGAQGAAAVTGTFAWEDGSMIPNAGDTVKATAIFTPTGDDAENFLKTSFTVTFAVAKATPKGTPTFTAITEVGVC